MLSRPGCENRGRRLFDNGWKSKAIACAACPGLCLCRACPGLCRQPCGPPCPLSSFSTAAGGPSGGATRVSLGLTKSLQLVRALPHPHRRRTLPRVATLPLAPTTRRTESTLASRNRHSRLRKYPVLIPLLLRDHHVQLLPRICLKLHISCLNKIFYAAIAF